MFQKSLHWLSKSLSFNGAAREMLRVNHMHQQKIYTLPLHVIQNVWVKTTLKLYSKFLTQLCSFSFQSPSTHQMSWDFPLWSSHLQAIPYHQTFSCPPAYLSPSNVPAFFPQFSMLWSPVSYQPACYLVCFVPVTWSCSWRMFVACGRFCFVF